MRRQAAIVMLCGLQLAACGTASLDERRAAAALVAAKAGWQRLSLDARAFALTAFVPPQPRGGDTLTVYIEGDGLAWLDAATPSFDPTPLDPVALRLALKDPALAAYLARPCQFASGAGQRRCDMKYWTSHRFAPEVIEATNSALDQLKARHGVQRLALVGYSGGGAVAALAAGTRTDVVRLTTIAAPLDHRAWTSAESLTPLSGSLNPADAWAGLRRIPQTHYVGGRDRNVGESVARAYASRFPPAERPRVVVVPTFDHDCCWAERWPALD